jgi:hypothetical protein
MHASALAHSDTVEFLLQAGADTEAKDKVSYSHHPLLKSMQFHSTTDIVVPLGHFLKVLAKANNI